MLTRQRLRAKGNRLIREMSPSSTDEEEVQIREVQADVHGPVADPEEERADSLAPSAREIGIRTKTGKKGLAAKNTRGRQPERLGRIVPNFRGGRVEHLESIRDSCEDRDRLAASRKTEGSRLVSNGTQTRGKPQGRCSKQREEVDLDRIEVEDEFGISGHGCEGYDTQGHTDNPMKTRQTEGSRWKAAGSRWKAADRVQKRSRAHFVEEDFDEEIPKKAHRSLIDDLQAKMRRQDELIDLFLSERKTAPTPVHQTMKLESIPEYDPSQRKWTTRQWIHTLEQFREMFKWTETTTIYHMQARLRGTGRDWYDNLEDYQHSWEEWKALLLLNFPEPRNHAVDMERMRARVKKPDESYEKYYFDKRSLLRPCQLTPWQQVDHILEGITDKVVKASGRAGRYDTPEVLYQHCILPFSQEGIQQESGVSQKKCYKCDKVGHIARQCNKNPKADVKNNSKPSVGTDGKKSWNQSDKGSGNQNNDKKFDLKHKLKNNTNWGKEQHKNPIKQEDKRTTCFNCNGEGHRVRDCPREKVQCSKCHWYGHEAEKCPKVSIKKVNIEGRICESGYTECKVDDVLIVGFLDSGSEVTTIRRDVANELQLKIEPQQTEITGYGKVHSGYTQGIVEVKLVMGNYDTNAKIYVVSNELQEEDIVIGKDILYKADLEAFIKAGKWWFFKDNTEETDLNKRKIPLTPSESIILPPQAMRLCKLKSTTPECSTVFVEGGQRGPEIYIPRCITSPNGFLPVINITDKETTVSPKRILARAVQADLDVNTEEISLRGNNLFTLSDLQNVVGESAEEEDVKQLLDLVNEFRDCFAADLSELGISKIGSMEITLLDSEPVVYRPYRLSHSEREYVKEHIMELKKYGVVRDSQSPYSSPILLVKKKDGSLRMCCDFRRLNAKIVRQQYPLPRIDDLIDRMLDAKCFSSLDLAWGYWQIPMEPSSIDKTSFVTPDGQFEWLRQPFGLSNGGAVFQRVINAILAPLSGTGIVAYLDDIMIPSKDCSENLKKLRQIFEALRKANLTLRLEKCRFLFDKVSYLGHEIENGQVRPGIEKIKAVESFPQPKSVKEVRQFIGLASYFRKFIKDFSLLASPLTQLTKKEVEFTWQQTHQKAFETLKKKLTTRPVLAIYNPAAKTELHTDACSTGIAGILMQQQPDNTLKPVLYFSQQTTNDEKKYHSYELETLAIVRSLQRMRVYLFGKKFKVVTDCSALRYTLTKKDINPRIARWWLLIQDFEFDVEYRAGTSMRHVDALSRSAVGEVNSQDTDTIADKAINIKRMDKLDLDDWVKIAQMQDAKCRDLMDAINSQKPTSRDKEIRRDFVLKKGRLYKRTDDGLKWVVPRSARAQILQMYHDDNAHPGITKTEELVRQRFWFPKLRKYVQDYLRACLNCLYVKPKRGESCGAIHPIPKPQLPMDTIHMDHLGPFLQTTRKNTHLLVIVDAFTKYVWLWPCKSTTTKGVINFVEQLASIFGFPRRIIADRGTAFKSEQFRQYCKEHGITLILTAVSTPRAAGQVERVNAVVLDKLIAIIPDEVSWDKYLSRVTMSINNSVSESTGKTPNELLLGFRPRQSTEAPLANEIDLDRMEDTGMNLQDAFEQKRMIDRREAIKKNKEVQNKMIEKNKDRRAARKFNEEDTVLITNQNPATKTKLRFKGPYKITKVHPHDRYKVEQFDKQHRKYDAVHAPEHLKRVEIFAESSAESDVSETEDK